MKLFAFIFVMSLTTTTFAIATPLDRINRESSVCMGQTYSPEHLRAHPLQTVQSIAMQLFEQPDQKDNTVYLDVRIKTADRAYDAFMLCDRRKGGLSCAVECDGGQAEVVTIGKSEHNLQFVNKGFMMSGVCGGDEGESVVFLEPTPGGDDVFSLETMEKCE